MTFVILSGGIDLSIGSVIAFTGIFLAVLFETTSIHPIRLPAGARHHHRFGALMGAIILSRNAGLHRHARRHVPGARHGLRVVDRLDPVKHPFYATLKTFTCCCRAAGASR